MHLMYFSEQPMSAYPVDEGKEFGATALMFSNRHFNPVEGSRLYNEYLEHYRLAETVELRVNPVNGIAEVLRHQDVQRVVRREDSVEKDDDSPQLLPFSVDEITSLGIIEEVAQRAVEVTHGDGRRVAGNGHGNPSFSVMPLPTTAPAAGTFAPADRSPIMSQMSIGPMSAGVCSGQSRRNRCRYSSMGASTARRSISWRPHFNGD